MADSHWLSILLLGFLVMVSQSYSDQVCPDSWNYWQGSCYKFFSKTENWNSAKKACEALGSKLVVINSPAENREVGESITGRLGTFIGLFRNPRDESDWVWVDQSGSTYTNWDSGEPNDYENLGEDCVHMRSGLESKEYKWNDLRCNVSHNIPYVCETRALVGTCPTTWTALEGSCIKLWNQSLTWSAAKSLCEEFGSKLAVIKSEAKNQAISAILSTDKAWIGLYRDPKTHSNWLWVDGSRLSYTNWGTDQPQNTEGCVVIYSKSGDWHDYPCADEKREIPSFYCETFGTRAPGQDTDVDDRAPGQDTDVDDTPSPNLSHLQIIGIAFGAFVGVVLVLGVGVFLTKKCKRREHHYARSARSERHPSPSAPRQELAAVENDYTRPPPTNPHFVQVNEV